MCFINFLKSFFSKSQKIPTDFELASLSAAKYHNQVCSMLLTMESSMPLGTMHVLEKMYISRASLDRVLSSYDVKPLELSKLNHKLFRVEGNKLYITSPIEVVNDFVDRMDINIASVELFHFLKARLSRNLFIDECPVSRSVENSFDKKLYPATAYTFFHGAETCTSIPKEAPVRKTRIVLS